MIPILLGAFFGAGLAVLAYGLRPPRPHLASALARLSRPARSPEDREKPRSGRPLERCGRGLVPLLRTTGLPSSALRRDLVVAERGVETFLATKAATAGIGLLLPWLACALLTVGVGWTGWWMPTSASLLLAVAFFFLPDGEVRGLARRRREELRHTLSVVLDLTVISLAGGAGIHQALHDATNACRGWAAGQMRQALAAAQVTRTNPWQHLGGLGRRTGVSELEELAGTVMLAGTEGAKVRASLQAKAQAMRRRQLTQAEGAAQAATERMAFPVLLQFLGFLTFIGTPALSHVLSGL
ncbi:type II secretion system F family protein [Streptomyces sp. NBRC 109706]|uniref:type II secretion system F family protein n=1 Tax=Streptomyces sp. NBRC 109706 TaxID=1550035 RepID=UPI000786733B|nr:type II secretion system F family protein [Streptomyces sp. NBRC 109706]